MPSLRLAVFDVDGTLIDSQHAIVTAMTRAWEQLGLDPPPAGQVRRIIGLSLLDACRALSPDSCTGTIVAMAEAYKAAFCDLRRQTDGMEPLFPGAQAALDRLDAEGWLLGIATGKSRRGVDHLLDSLGLDGRFITIQTPDNNPGKPHPGMLLRAAAESGTEARRIAMIGDTSYDMSMAVTAGAVAIGVSWGNHSRDELRAAGARTVIEAFDQLAECLDTEIGERTCS
jgi:phosphoglycolate phosphatase